MSSIDRHPGGRWRARYRTPDGRSRSKVFAREGDAKRWLTEVDHQKWTGSYVDPRAGRVTFRTYAERWRARKPWRRSTAQSVEQHLRLHVYPVIGDRPIGAILPSEVQALVDGLGQNLSASTAQVIYGRVRSVFRAAMRDRMIPSTPCDGDMELPQRSGASAVEVLTTEQVWGLADAIASRYRALVIAGAGTGLRPGELFGLTLDRVNFLKRSVHVDRQMVRVRGGGVELGDLKTKRSTRTVPLPSVVGEELAAHLDQWPPVEGLMFTNERGAAIRQHPFAMVWATARAKAGLPGWATPHDLRHYYASLLIARGASVKVVQNRLGHASAKTTLDTYSHLWPDDEDATRATVDAELGGCRRPVRAASAARLCPGGGCEQLLEGGLSSDGRQSITL